MWKVQLFKLNFDEREEEAVAAVVRGGWLTMGEETRRFEEEFAEFLAGGARCTALANGTAALHTALLALGIGPGDDVLVPALTFVADLNVVLMVGARPVLMDCASLTDWNVGAGNIAAALTPKTRAVLLVHYAGFPCAMDPILDLCGARGIPVIEDAAHAPGAEYRGRRCGTIGALGCFSFFSNKNLSVGEGGMIVTTNEELDRNNHFIRSHGMTTLTLDRHQGRAITYDVARPGLNYRLDEMRAALGRVQLRKLVAANQGRAELTRLYRERLRGVPGLSLPFLETPADCLPSYHIFPVLLDASRDRGAVIRALQADGIQSSIHYPAFQEFSAFRDLGLGETPVASEISRRELTLPLYPTMTEAELELVTSSLIRALS